MSDEHRLGVEVTVKKLHNRISEVSGEPVAIDVEKWIGIRSDFVIADVRVEEPLRIAAEVYYKQGDLALTRRLGTMFDNDYRTYLIFHTMGCHNVTRVERHLQKVSPLRVGRFDRENLEVTLGDLFTATQIDLSSSSRKLLPNYLW